MAVYDGFFDAEVTGENEDGTPKYDRAYESGDFTDYFANIIGSGVCIHENPDSFKAEYEDGTLYLRPGYLFIQGYWLANKAGPNEEADTYKGYAVTLPANMTGSLAVVAHLNLGQRMIEIETRSVSQAYPDALVLAIVTASTAEDTRHNTDLCGVIDSAGDLSGKVEDAINFIDNEVEGKLEAAEAEIDAQAAKLDAKIAEVQAVADRIAPPPIGSIKFSASQDVDEEWLKCDGSFVNEADYPELVAALGKLTPSGDKFQVISSGEIGAQISNGVLYGGRLWVYSYSTGKLYGVDVEGTAAIKEITLTSEDSAFAGFTTPTTTSPLALSIVPSASGGSTAKLFLAQVQTDLLIFGASFDAAATSLTLSKPFPTVDGSASYDSKACVPYVFSETENGEEYFYCATTGVKSSGIFFTLKWKNGENATVVKDSSDYHYGSEYESQRLAYTRKNKGESVLAKFYYTSSGTQNIKYIEVVSKPSNLFSRNAYSTSGSLPTNDPITVPNALNVVGTDKLLFEFTPKEGLTISITSVEAPVKFETGISTPSGARCFVDGAAYLWGKDIYMIFVGTGIIFSRTLETGSFGYLDTTSVLGTITQFGYLDYAQDEGTLYLLGQDTTNKVKVAKMVLNTLFDYANDGAWLPMIASDGVPAYIKAKGDEGGDVITDPVTVTVTVSKAVSNFDSIATVLFNGDELIGGTYTRTVSQSGMFTVGLRIKNNSNTTLTVKLNGTTVISVYTYNLSVGYEKTESFKVSDFLTSGITLQGTAT